MKKFLLILILILVAALVAVYFSMDIIIKEAVQKYVPPITKTDIHITSVHTSIFDGEFKVKGLAVGNPAGFKTPNAFTLGEIEVVMDMKSLFKDVIYINKIVIDRAVATLEISKSGTNIGTIHQNITDYMKKNESTDKVETTKNKEKSKKVIVKELTLQNSSVQLASNLTRTQKTMNIPLPTIRLQNIGNEKNPITIERAFAIILSTISQQSMQSLTQNVQSLLPDIQGEITKIKGQVNTFKGQVEEAKQRLNETKENFKSLTDDLKNAFSNQNLKNVP